MMRLYFVTISSVAGAGVVLLAGLLVLPYILDLAPTPDNLATAIKNDTGFAVAIDGAVAVRLLPRPHIVATKLRLQAGDKIHLKAEIDKARINLSISHLFSQSVRVANIVVNGGRIDIFAHAQMDNLLGFVRQFTEFGMRGENLDVRVHGLAQDNQHTVLQLQAVSADFSRPLWTNDSRSQISGKFNNSPFNFNLIIATGADYRERLPVSLIMSFDASEQLTFDGFVGTNRHFIADGEIGFKSARQLPQMVRNFGLQLNTGADMTARGLVYLDSTQLRSDGLEVRMFGTDFAAQIDGRFGEDNVMDDVLVRLNTKFVNLDIFSTTDSTLQPASPIAAQIGQQKPSLLLALAPFFNLPRLDVQLSATRFLIGDEAGRNLQLDIALTKQSFDFERFSADMPFNSSILGNGALVHEHDESFLRGIISVRSSDALMAAQWLGERLEVDIAQVTQLNEQKFQRLSFVTDFIISEETVRLENLTGRLGDSPFNLALAVNDNRTIIADFEIETLDMDDWGIATQNALIRQPKSRNAFSLGNIAFDAALRGLLVSPLANYQITLQAKTPQLLAGAERFGGFLVAAHSTGEQVHITNMQFDNLNGVQVQASGQLGHDGKELSGGLDVRLSGAGEQGLIAPILERLHPLKVDINVPIDIAMSFHFTAPKNAAWPNILTQGEGLLGDIAVAFDTSTPSRHLNFDEVGSRAHLTLNGKANALAARLSLPPQYAAQSTGALVLDYDVLAPAVSNLTAKLKLADDKIELEGAIRPASAGRQLVGSIALEISDVFPMIWSGEGGQVLPMNGKSQLTVTENTASFSNIDFLLGTGRLMGEGLFDMRRKRPVLNASLVLQNFDGTAFLPIFAPNKNWSQTPMRWALLGLSDADVQARLNNLRFGKVQLDNVVSRLKLVEGVLEASKLAVTAWGGEGVFDIQAVGGDLTPSLSVNGKFTSINLASWLTQIYGRPLIDVGLDGAVEVKMRGRSAAEIISSTQGTFRFDGNNGRIDFFDLAGFNNALTTGITTGLTQKPNHLWQGDTRFQRVLGLAIINKGIINSDSAELIIENNEQFASLKAELDLTRLQSKAELRFYPLDDQRTLIYRLSGLITQPKITLDTSAFDAPISDKGSADNITTP
ncbi:MAG: AsmA family protein [Parvibaculales bacterium]